MKRRNEYDLKATGENLRRCREKMRLSVEHVRRFMRLSSVQAVYKWEKGKCFPTTDNFFALAELYRTNPMDILVKLDIPEEPEPERELICVECAYGNVDYRIQI